MPLCAESTYALRPPQSNARDALDMLQAKLRNSLAGLLFIAGVDGNRAACGNGGIAALACLNVRVGAVASVLDLGGLLVWLVWELLDAWVRHDL